MFYGSDFIFNNISSQLYDLRILNFETSGVQNSSAGSESTLFQKWVYRKPKPYFYGRSQNIPLEFDLEIGSFDPIAGFSRTAIEEWLLSKSTYLPFQVVQEDISKVIFDVIFSKGENKYVGNIQRGMTLHGKCNAPWGYESPKTLIKTYVGGGIAYETFNFYNGSDDSEYLYPQINFTMNGGGNYFTLTNTSDNNRIFSFTGLSTGEVMTVDNNLQQMISSTGLLRMDNFNRKFFRLIPGMNVLILTGGISNFNMTYSFARKVGV